MDESLEERLDRVAPVKAVTEPIGVEIAPYFERIELRVSDIDRRFISAVCEMPSRAATIRRAAIGIRKAIGKIS